MKPIMRSIVLLAVAILAFQTSRSMQSRAQTRNETKRLVTPLTLVERETDRNIEIEKLTAIRKDGAKAVRTLSTPISDVNLYARNILLPGERRYVVIVDAIKAVSSFYMTEAAAEQQTFVTVSPDCGRSWDEARLVGESVMLGYPVLEYLVETKGPQGLRQRERTWRAPDLDCRALKFVQESLDSDGNVVKAFESWATSVKVGDPDNSLFIVPANYREMPPSQANREMREHRTVAPFGENPHDARILKTTERMDAKYFEAQKYKP